MKASDRTASGSNGFMTLKVELPPTGIVRTISVPEIACLKSEGPDGLEDFGWQWHYAESLKALKENPDSGKDDECEIAGWVGLDTPAEVERYLAGESAEVKTRKLKKALSHVKVVIPPKAENAPAQSSEPKIPRNAPCPCGSGKKYKLCCGRGKA